MTDNQSPEQSSLFPLRNIIFPGLLFFIFGILAYAGFNSILAYTNTMEFCTSCHSMTFNLEEYKETIHYKNPSGVQATCPDCHVPKDLLPKIKAKILAVKDVLHELLGTINTKEKFEAHRWEMASRVWNRMKTTDSRECRSCHNYNNMDFEEQEHLAQKQHPRALSKGQTCIDCHQGIAHEEPDEPDEDLDE